MVRARPWVPALLRPGPRPARLAGWGCPHYDFATELGGDGMASVIGGLTAKGRWYLLGSSFSGLLGFVLLFTIGMRYTSANHGALILAALPLFTGLLAAVFERRPLALRWWAGSALALGGEGVLILRGGSI